jgi:hypothetical protein
MKIDCPFKEFKDLFGIKKKGIHSYRFSEDTAIIDYFITIIGCLLLSHFTKVPLVLTTIIVLLLGILVHLLFGVETNSLKYLGITCN